ncbi:hypothetical protein F5Y03DRAFT_199428 [Xylaria venustula]|nr:hypothetical protein F5Y03DRAFT_199428 [Xylaria venustula]
MSTNETAKLNSAGGPLFRRPDISHEEFATAWHRHGRLVMPWALKYGVWEYIQIHMPDPESVPRSGDEETTSKEDDTVEARAKRILRQADGVAVMRRYDVPTEAGQFYFKGTILQDERRFLHDESGAGAVKADPPVYDVPELRVDVWRELALALGGVEHVKIREGKDVSVDAKYIGGVV